MLENFLRPLGVPRPSSLVTARSAAAGAHHRGRCSPTSGSSPASRRSGRAAAGVAPLELARSTDLGQYAEWSDPERIVGNLHRAYADLAGPAEARGCPVNFTAALTDMIAYNGGRPLTCRA